LLVLQRVKFEFINAIREDIPCSEFDKAFESKVNCENRKIEDISYN